METGKRVRRSELQVVVLFRRWVLDDERQVGYYHPGVGTEGRRTAREQGGSRFSRRLQGWRWVVFFFFFGLLAVCGGTIRYLMNVYRRRQDSIIWIQPRRIYGCGAGGMVSMYGLLRAGKDGMIPYILKMFFLCVVFFSLAEERGRQGGCRRSTKRRPGFRHCRKTFSRM